MIDSAACGEPRGARTRIPHLTALGAFVLVACGGGGGDSTGPDPETPVATVCASPTVGVEVGGFAPPSDVRPTPTRRVVLMGGGPEADAAAREFVEAANGGDVLVLRASGSLTSYPSYFRDDLAPTPAPNSVETVKTTDPSAAAQAAVLCRIGNAEGIWLAGGNQSNYLRGWPQAVHDALAAARDRGVAIGGTSAGSVSLGEAAFDAREGSVTSAEALADPFRADVTLTYPTWAQAELDGVYVDSHFADRDREGRLLVFLARFAADRGHDRVVGVGLDEGMALVIENGTYRVERSTRRGPDQRAWLYEVTGPATLAPGIPLGLEGVRRVGLAEGAAGSWPLDFDAVTATSLTVVDGQVTEG